jgi:SAM-dependent methyltransferase
VTPSGPRPPDPRSSGPRPSDERPANPRWPGRRTAERAIGYAARFAALAATGVDVHGEAAFCAALVPVPARVLDAGCGTGRVALRLAELGYDCVGVDSDSHMLDQARASSHDVQWALADLADQPDLAGPAGVPDLATGFDLVVAAGNVIPLVAPGTEAHVVANLAGALRGGAPLVSGFGLDAAHLPLPAAPFDLAEYDAWCAAAGLVLEQRFATWAGDPYDGGGYAVSVHRHA